MNFEATTTEQEALDASAEYNCDMVEPRMPVGHDGSQPIHSWRRSFSRWILRILLTHSVIDEASSAVLQRVAGCKRCYSSFGDEGVRQIMQGGSCSKGGL